MKPTSRQFKDAIYGHLARIGRAMSAPKRLELLGLLCEGPRTVDALAKLTGLSVANTSQHLRVLHGSRLVHSEKRGLFVEYRVADPGVLEFLHRTHELAESCLAEVREVTTSFLTARGALEPVSAADLLRRVRNGQVTVIDVRPAEEYRAGHIPGALSIPLPELKARMRELPVRREIVAYCRGRYCVMAIDAVQLLREAGYRAVRMELGVIDWRVRGWRIEKPTGRTSAAGAGA